MPSSWLFWNCSSRWSWQCSTLRPPILQSYTRNTTYCLPPISEGHQPRTLGWNTSGEVAALERKQSAHQNVGGCLSSLLTGICLLQQSDFHLLRGFLFVGTCFEEEKNRTWLAHKQNSFHISRWKKQPRCLVQVKEEILQSIARQKSSGYYRNQRLEAWLHFAIHTDY